MAKSSCGWFCAGLLCCLACSGTICFLVFGGTVTLALFGMSNNLNKCEGSALGKAEMCLPDMNELENITTYFEPKFDAPKELEQFVGLCEETTKCMAEVTCASYIATYRSLKPHCEVYSFIKNEDFQTCLADLKKKADEELCLKFLFSQEPKCDGWMDNLQCVERNIESLCGMKIRHGFSMMSIQFMKGPCAEIVTSRQME